MSIFLATASCAVGDTAATIRQANDIKFNLQLLPRFKKNWGWSLEIEPWSNLPGYHRLIWLWIQCLIIGHVNVQTMNVVVVCAARGTWSSGEVSPGLSDEECGGGAGGETAASLASRVRQLGRRGLVAEYEEIRARPPQGTFHNAELVTTYIISLHSSRASWAVFKCLKRHSWFCIEDYWPLHLWMVVNVGLEDHNDFP